MALLGKTIELYSDFRRDFLVNPVTKDVARHLNEHSIKEAIQNLILTDKGEVLFNPTKGSDVKKFLFDNLTPITVKMLKSRVSEVIEFYEPRAKDVTIDIFAPIDGYEVVLTIYYTTDDSAEQKIVNIPVKRMR